MRLAAGVGPYGPTARRIVHDCKGNIISHVGITTYLMAGWILDKAAVQLQGSSTAAAAAAWSRRIGLHPQYRNFS